MSYDISLLDPVTKEVIQLGFTHEIRGGTYRIGGSQEAWLNITYNYADHLYRVIDGGIRAIYGLTGAESIPILEEAVAALGDYVSEDYFAATEGNTKRALLGLLAFAKLRPDGVWSGD